MSNRCLVTCILIVSFYFPTWAQYSVKGKIIDTNTLQAIEFVNISINQPNETNSFTGTTSDKDGFFEIKNLKNGTYTVQFSFIGYNNLKKTITIKGESFVLKRIKLTENSEQLSELEVIGQGSTMRFELDRKVFSVDQNIASAGGTVTDVLQNIPSVDVDAEGNISLRNNANVEVWINGKPAGLTAENRGQVLQQMPAENIQDIELITNSSAKFSPEGTAGIINLVMKKNRKAGYYGSVSTGIIYPWGGTPGYNAGGSVNFNKGIVDAYVNIGYRRMNMQKTSLEIRHNYNTNDTTRLDQVGEAEFKHGGFFARAGVDLRITEKSSIGVSGFGMFGTGTNEENISYNRYDGVAQNANLLRNYDRSTTGYGSRPSYNITVDYKVDFTKKQNLLASATYSAHERNFNDTYTQRNLANNNIESEQEQDLDAFSDMWEIKVDYTNKFTEKSKLEAGWHTTLQNRNSFSDAKDLQTQKPLEAYYNEFDYKEQVHAAYITYGNKFFDKLSAQIGLRGEYLIRNSYTNKVPSSLEPYFMLFPSAYLSYALPENNEVQLNYSRRIHRPRGRSLNPRRDFSDSTNIYFGNPDLNPELSSSLELNYLKNWEQGHTFSVGLFYRFTDDIIQNVRYVTNGFMENTYINISKSQNAGMEIVAKNRLFGNLLQLTTSLAGYYNTMDAAHHVFNETTTIKIPEQTNFAWNARVNAMFMFTKTFSGQLSGKYSSPYLVAQGKTSHRYAIDLGLRKMFFDRKLSVNLMVRDLLNSQNREYERWGENFYQYSESLFMGRTVGLHISYNFGNLKPKNGKSQKDNPMSFGNEEMTED